MLYICIPAYNEADTVGLLLWRIRKVFQGFPREYELVVFNDGSSDATGETLASYSEALPLTVLGGQRRWGYARALDALLRDVAGRCRYVRRDAVIVMQADFTDQPEHIPELVKRFEGGADIVVAQSVPDGTGPKAVRRLRRLAPWLLRPFVSVPGVRDPLGSLRLFRVSVLREAIRVAGTEPLVRFDSWAANVDLLLTTIPHARRVETAELSPRYDLRPRDSRVRPFADALALVRFGRMARGRRPATREAVQA